jgi:hypothetical protein
VHVDPGMTPAVFVSAPRGSLALSFGVMAWTEPTAAIGTVGTFVFGFVLFALDRADRRRAQARLVAAWAEELEGTGDESAAIVYLRNGSAEPVCDVYMTSRLIEAEPISSRVLPPGKTVEIPAVAELAPRYELYGSDFDLEFVDAAGRRWRRLPDGRLRRVRLFRSQTVVEIPMDRDEGPVGRTSGGEIRVLAGRR